MNQSEQANHNSPRPSSTSRRTFLKGATTTGAAVGAGTLAATVPNVHAAGDSLTRVGLIGCGGRGSGAEINAMNADSDVQIVALADLFPASIESCRKSLGQKNRLMAILGREV